MKLYAAHLDLSSIAKEFKVPTAFDEEVTHAAARARDQFAATRTDKRDIPLVTIDPEGSMDLDQAVFIDKPSGGMRLCGVLRHRGCRSICGARRAD